MNELETGNPQFDKALEIVRTNPKDYGLPIVGEPVSEGSSRVFTQRDFEEQLKAAAMELMTRARRRTVRQHTGGPNIPL